MNIRNNSVISKLYFLSNPSELGLFARLKCERLYELSVLLPRKGFYEQAYGDKWMQQGFPHHQALEIQFTFVCTDYTVDSSKKPILSKHIFIFAFRSRDHHLIHHNFTVSITVKYNLLSSLHWVVTSWQSCFLLLLLITRKYLDIDKSFTLVAITWLAHWHQNGIEPSLDLALPALLLFQHQAGF